MKLWKVYSTNIYCHFIVMAETEDDAKQKAAENIPCGVLGIKNAEELPNGISVEYE